MNKNTFESLIQNQTEEGISELEDRSLEITPTKESLEDLAPLSKYSCCRCSRRKRNSIENLSQKLPKIFLILGKVHKSRPRKLKG